MSKTLPSHDTLLPKNLFLFIWRFLYPYKFVIFLFFILAAGTGVSGPFNNLLIKNIINLLVQIKGGDVSLLILPATLILLNFIVFDKITYLLIGYINYKYKCFIKNKILRALLAYIFVQSNQFFKDNLSGRIFNQMTILADNIELILFKISLDFISGASLLTISFLTSFFVNPVFCYILMIWFLCFSVFSIWMSKQISFFSSKYAENESLLSGQLVDIITNQNNIRFFSRKKFELTRIDYFFEKLLRASRRKEWFVIILYAIQGSMIALMIMFVLYFLVYFYNLDLVTIGDFTLILGLSMELGHMMWSTMTCVDEFNYAYGKCKQSLSALIMPIEVKDIPDAKKLQVTQGEIIFDNVTFNYKDAGLFFQNKSIVIKAGQKIGLVGYSGSGKSTFVNLILRLYDVTSGRILIDGQDIHDVTQASLHNAISVIPQDPSLFHRTIMENIRYGCITATDQEVIEAAKKSHANEFITTFTEGYNTFVGEGGAKLSGGQRQRIAISRAFLKNAPILILDEATSQLDSITENLIQESLWNLMQNKTTIVIAHRLSTLLSMDRILVFDKGKVVEDGTHGELLKKDGLYTKLWNAQVGEFLGDEKKLR